MAVALSLAGPICAFWILQHPANRQFQFAHPDEPGAVRAIVHVVTADDAESPSGLIAWRPKLPEDFYTFPSGGLPALGIDQLDNPASYFGGRPLPVHRTPLGWLANGCRGIVPLDSNSLWFRLNSLPERTNGWPLAVEDIDHGDAISADLNPLPLKVRLYIPDRRAAA
jgi:hypothetical protein